MKMNHANDPSDPIGLEQAQHERLCEYVFGEMQGEERAAFERELASDAQLAEEHARLTATIGLVSELPTESLSEGIRSTLRAAAEAEARKKVAPSRPVFTFLRGGGATYAKVGIAAAAVVVAALTLFDADDGGPLAPQHAAKLEEAPRELSDARRDGVTVTRRDEARAQAEEAAEGPFEPTASAEASATSGADYLSVHGWTGEVVVDASKELERQIAGLEKSEPKDSGVDRAEATTLFDTDASQGARAYDDAASTGADGFFLGRGEKKQGGNFRGPGDTIPPPLEQPNLEAQGANLIAPTVAAVSAAPSPGSSAGPSSAGPSSPGPLAPGAPSGTGSGARFSSRFGGNAPSRQSSSQDQEAQRDVPASLRALGYLGDAPATDDETSGEVDADRGDGAELRQVWMSSAPGLRDLAQADESTEEDRRAAYDARVTVLLDGCMVRPHERPGDMFFRTWGAHPFVRTADDALSTFSIDVDTASYTLARRTLRAGRLPERAQVRTEEFLNYFRPDLAAPTGDDVFRVGFEAAPSPFVDEANAELLRVTVRGKDVAAFERQPLALTFVTDVSGSMSGERLDMVKHSMDLLMTQLSYTDSIAVIAFNAGTQVVAPMTSASNRGVVEDAVAALSAGGGTSVERGLTHGFQLAAEALVPNAVNRVILLSDGVGNIGETDQARILEQVEEFKKKGIYLNTIGVGMGDHNDAFLEQLANRGDGVCSYIDSKDEAEKAMVDEFTKTLQPIARDVKIQVEFDPNQVVRYRQLGYENRVIADADFRNDAVDAGEVNAGHQVTALYEIVRSGNGGDAPLAKASVRYKRPFAIDRGDGTEVGAQEAEVATEIQASMTQADLAPTFRAASFGFRRAAIVAQFAELLRESIHTRRDSLAEFVAEAGRLANENDDPEMVELLELIELAFPKLEARAAATTDELAALLDELARLHYERGVREQTRKEGEEVDAEAEEALAVELAMLETRVRQLVAERMGVELEANGEGDGEAEDPLERLRALGYQGDR